MTIQIYELCGENPDLLFSPHCWKIRMAVAHKGLEWKTIPVPFTEVATIEGGESRRIPVIRDGETVVEESYAIARYLDTSYPEAPGLFNGDGAQALTVHTINWVQTALHTEIAKLIILDIHNSLAPKDQAFFRVGREKMFGCTLEEFDARHEKNGDLLGKALLPLELTLKKQKYMGGDSPLFADYAAFGALQWLRVCSGKDYLAKDSAVSLWFDTLLDMYGGIGRRGLVTA